MRFAAVFALSLFLSITAQSAHAADIGACMPPDAMTAALKAEDQHSIVTADIITNDKRLYGLIVTMSGDRKTGYILKSDQPLADRAGQLCVYNRLANIRLFDARKPGVPAAALLNVSETDALKRCENLAGSGTFKRSACGSLNTDLRKVEVFGERVAVQGLLTRKDTDGRYVPDGPSRRSRDASAAPWLTSQTILSAEFSEASATPACRMGPPS